MAGTQAGEGGDTAHTTPLQDMFWHARPGAELHCSVAVLVYKSSSLCWLCSPLGPLGGPRGGDRRCSKDDVLQSRILLS